ncbi:hypothetical protein GGS23DRAFT_148788 [Durotheca rogersii]|uniref:uncharacterized protein n=1 Tax=Durotheca rogersii TaxID=419775 RepID=UPI00221EC0ED|nr:uncharacterized protein GGS23DRAFT_148788 [Durotheca rogersii]KAI5861388.1 hypothetical protein GGS23DRAFT_148788 [Durotheca rogersii]
MPAFDLRLDWLLNWVTYALFSLCVATSNSRGSIALSVYSIGGGPCFPLEGSARQAINTRSSTSPGRATGLAI